MVAEGSRVLIVGAEGVGVRTLVAACAELDDRLELIVGPDESRSAAVGVADGVGVAVFVVDPMSAVGEEERRRLAALRAAYGTVGVVCAKIDAFWDWPRIARAHRDALDPSGALPIFAVSALAARAGEPTGSGIPDLVAWLREELDAPLAQRRAEAASAAARSSVDDLLAEESTDRDGTMIADLQRRRRALVENRDRGRADRLAAVRAGLTRARAETVTQVQHGLQAIAARMAEAPAIADPEQMLRNELGLLSAEVSRTLSDRIDEVGATALLGLGGVTGASAASDTGVQIGDPRPIRDGRGRGAEDALMVVIGASTGLGVGRLIVAPMASVHTLQWISMPLTLVLGVAVAVAVIRTRRSSSTRTEVRAWLRDALADARIRADREVGLRVGAAETGLCGQITRSYDRNIRLTAAAVADLDGEMRRIRNAAADRRLRLDQARDLHRQLSRAGTSQSPEQRR
ncbi:hypothetical protein QSJ18_00190 [Gordonia sp. ABSL1-1]|uniref:hypothetical protein n=1 Tax=Gordonia sp. ABSL1-1 TaxID=3053923 RepID=UPI002572A647|nr:hypothetical protein [Gordonia sp. ABSL1-1]MDL9935155.1 hypothetical protein [Gordonia sp. ABSL1-1]